MHENICYSWLLHLDKIRNDRIFHRDWLRQGQLFNKGKPKMKQWRDFRM